MAYPSYIPKAGDVLVLTRPMSTMADKTYGPGDKFTLIETTDEMPHGYQSGLCNWRVKCKHMTSVWSAIWTMIDHRTLVPEAVYADLKPEHVGTHFIGERTGTHSTTSQG